MIDRERVIKALECCDSSVFDCEHCSYGNPLSSMDECHDILLRDACELLREQEGIVRCKECKYANHETPFYDIWCNRISIGCYEDWFCADGERREEE